MIISCPNCSTRFRLNADLLGDAGRNVKCAKCAHRWFAEPNALSAEPAPAKAAPPPPARPPPAAPEEAIEEPPVEAEPPSSPVPESTIDEENDVPSTPPPIPTEEEIARFQKQPPPSKSTLKWWILLLVVIALLVGSLFYYRRPVVAFYPPSAKLFMLFGLGGDVLGSGLEIPDYKIASRLDGKDRVVLIKGEIKNTTKNVLDVPLLFGAIKDAKGTELRVWSFRTKEPRVLAGESVSYETEIRNPPRGGVNVSITFTTEAEMAAKKARAKAKTVRAKK
jgi:predicted Zn finger-like uncharacterized protein